MPLEPALPGKHDFGRLTISSPLLLGWPCRWCRRPLRQVVNAVTGIPSSALTCDNCGG